MDRINNQSLAIQKASIFPCFTDFHIRLHLKKWPCYIKNSSSGYQMETNKGRTEVHWTYRLVQGKLKSLQWVFSSYSHENISSKFFSCRFYTRFVKFVLSYFRLFSVLLIDVFRNSYTGNKENCKFNLCGATWCNSALNISLIFSWLS